MLLVSAALAVVISAGAAEEGTTPNGLILYEHQVDHGSWIEVRDFMGGSRRALTPRLKPGETRSDTDATWSPSATTVAFVRRRGKQEAIELVDADGLNLRQLVTVARLRPLVGMKISGLSGAMWSDDGNRLLFTVGGAPGAGCITEGIFSINADGSALRRLWRRPHSVTASADVYGWSPDGTNVLFSVDRNVSGGCEYDDYFGSNITVAPDTGASPRLVAHEGLIGNAEWSADGEAIAYSIDCESVCNLALAFPDGRRTRRLTHFRPERVGFGFTFNLPFAWSGRGKEIVFGHPLGSGDSRSLYSIDARTGVARKLLAAPCPGPTASCTYSLIYMYAVSTDGGIFVFDVYRDARGSATTFERYAAYVDEARLVRLPAPLLLVDDVYIS